MYQSLISELIHNKHPKFILTQYNLLKKLILTNSINLESQEFQNVKSVKIEINKSKITLDSFQLRNGILSIAGLNSKKKNLRLNIAVLLRVISEWKQKQLFKYHSELNLQHISRNKLNFNDRSHRVIQRPDENPFSDILDTWIDISKLIKNNYKFNEKKFSRTMNHLSLKVNVCSMVKYLNSHTIKEK